MDDLSDGMKGGRLIIRGGRFSELGGKLSFFFSFSAAGACTVVLLTAWRQGILGKGG